MNKLILLLFSAALVSCSGDTLNAWDKDFTSLNLIDTGCKDGINALSDDENEEEYVSYSIKTGENGAIYLHIDHYNCYFNCASDSINVQHFAEGNNVKIAEIGNSMAANCTCAHNLHYNIGPLSEKNFTVAIYQIYGETTAESLQEIEEKALGTFTINPSTKTLGRCQVSE